MAVNKLAVLQLYKDAFGWPLWLVCRWSFSNLPYIIKVSFLKLSYEMVYLSSWANTFCIHESSFIMKPCGSVRLIYKPCASMSACQISDVGSASLTFLLLVLLLHTGGLGLFCNYMSNCTRVHTDWCLVFHLLNTVSSHSVSVSPFHHK